MTKLILVSHGELAKGMKHTAQMIVGNIADPMEVYCLYSGMNPEDYADEMRRRIEADDEQYLFICDILGGSVHTALSQLLENERVRICSGMNLNLVIALLLENQQNPDDNAVMAAVKEAQMGITFKTCIDDNGEEEDF